MRISTVNDQRVDIVERPIDRSRALIDPVLMFRKTRRINRMRVKEWLMIPSKEQGLSVTFNSITKIGDRMVHQHSAYPSICDIERLRLCDRPKIKPCAQLSLRNREISILKLDLEDVFDASSRSILGTTVHMEPGSGIKQGFEHRQTIDVVPMTVRDQQMGLNCR